MPVCAFRVALSCAPWPGRTPQQQDETAPHDADQGEEAVAPVNEQASAVGRVCGESYLAYSQDDCSAASSVQESYFVSAYQWANFLDILHILCGISLSIA